MVFPEAVLSAVAMSSPLMPTYAPAAGDVRPRRGHPAVGRRPASATSTSCRASRSRRSATATPRSPRRCPSRPRRCCTSSNLFATPIAPEVADHARPRSSGRRPRRRSGVLLQLGRRGQRVRDQAGPQVGRARAPRRRERVRLVPRPHPRDAARHRPAGEARGLPAAARGLPSRGVVRPRRARSARSTRRSSAVLLEPVQGEGGVNPATAEYFAGVRRIVRRARAPVHGRRGADRASGAPASGSASSTSASSPTSSRWPRRSATACPIGACWARARGRRGVRARRPRHDVRRPAARDRPAARAVLAEMQREDVPALATARRRASSPTSSSTASGVTEVRGLGLLLAVELDGIDAEGRG